MYMISSYLHLSEYLRGIYFLLSISNPATFSPAYVTMAPVPAVSKLVAGICNTHSDHNQLITTWLPDSVKEVSDVTIVVEDTRYAAH